MSLGAEAVSLRPMRLILSLPLILLVAACGDEPCADIGASAKLEACAIRYFQGGDQLALTELFERDSAGRITRHAYEGEGPSSATEYVYDANGLELEVIVTY